MKKKNDQPLAVTVISWLNIATYSVTFAGIIISQMMSGGKFLNYTLRDNWSRYQTIPPWIAGTWISAVACLDFISCAAMLKGRRWGWKLYLWELGITTVLGYMFAKPEDFTGYFALRSLLNILSSVVFIYFLTRREVREYFNRELKNQSYDFARQGR